MIRYAGLDHVQVAIPVGGEARARAFYGDVLGLTQLPKPQEMAKRGGLWFACGNAQLHLGVEADFRAAKKAHPGLLLADREGFDELAARLVAAGYEARRDTEMEPEIVRFFTADPRGNRIEIACRLARTPDASRAP